jgi:hypothetical protein
MTTTLLALAVASLWIAVFLALPAWAAWRRWRGTRIVTCPETERPAAVDMDLRYAIAGSIAGRPELRLRDCSRWPQRNGCGQTCLTQIEESPDSCLVRTMVQRWYDDRTCAYCRRAFGRIRWNDHKMGLRSPDGRFREWSEVPAATLPDILLTHEAVCWNCMVADGIRRRLPDLFMKRAPRRGRNLAPPPV